MFFCLVLYHLYGRDGRDSKKVDTKSIMFDMEMFQVLTRQDIIDDIRNNITTFVEAINNNQYPGNTKYIFDIWLDYDLCLFVTAYSSDIAVSDVKSRNISSIQTTDPSVIIDITLEVLSNNNYNHAYCYKNLYICLALQAQWTWF